MHRIVIGALIAMTVASAGCFDMFGGGAGRLSEAEAREHTREAVEGFAADFSDPEGGDLKRITGHFEAEGGDDESSFGDFDMDILMEWGTGGTAHLKFELQSGGTSVTLEVYCSDDETVMVWGNDVLESRPDPDEACLDAIGDGTAESDPFELEDIDEELEDLEVTPHADGSVTATFTDENGTYTLEVDAQGRLTRIEIESEEADGYMQMDYGARSTITVPEATDRMPADVGGFGYFSSFSDPAQYEWGASSFGSGSYPLGEFEVRVLDPEGEVVADFKLNEGSSQSEAGFTFEFDDDGDGKFGANDTFTVSHPDWTEDGQYDVVVWDLWADRDIADNPIPGWGTGILAIALAGLAMLRRRR